MQAFLYSSRLSEKMGHFQETIFAPKQLVVLGNSNVYHKLQFGANSSNNKKTIFLYIHFTWGKVTLLNYIIIFWITSHKKMFYANMWNSEDTDQPASLQKQTEQEQGVLPPPPPPPPPPRLARLIK